MFQGYKRYSNYYKAIKEIVVVTKLYKRESDGYKAIKEIVIIIRL